MATFDEDPTRRPTDPSATRPVDAYGEQPTERVATVDHGRHAVPTADDRARDGDHEAAVSPEVAREEARAREEQRRLQVARQKEQFGGFHFGSAFFGWLVAVGLTAILLAVISAVGLGLGLSQNVRSVNDVPADARTTIGIVGAILVAVVVFVAYYAGGYVAGRMARFSGVKQGLAVWIWAVVIALVVAIIGAIAGAQYNLFGQLNVFPRLPIAEGDLTATGVITAVLGLVISLLGAILGGLLGTRYHRRVDRVGLGE